MIKSMLDLPSLLRLKLGAFSGIYEQLVTGEDKHLDRSKAFMPGKISMLDKKRIHEKS